MIFFQFDLAEQNKQLKEVIKQMTYDMKELHKLKQVRWNKSDKSFHLWLCENRECNAFSQKSIRKDRLQCNELKIKRSNSD